MKKKPETVKQHIKEELKKPAFKKAFKEEQAEIAKRVIRKCKEKDWDLPSALEHLVTRLPKLEQKRDQHGSCQDYRLRLVAQLIYFYNVPLKYFYEWNT